MKIITSWDDGAVQDIRLSELLLKHNIPAIFYWPCNLHKSINLNKVKKFITLSECKNIAKKFEIGSHGVTHALLTRITKEKVYEEINHSKKFWQDCTGQAIDSFCYPRGYANSEIKQMTIEAGYKNARLTKVGSITCLDDPFAITTTVHAGVSRKEYNGLSWQEYAIKMHQMAANNENSVFYVFGHSWEIEINNAWDDLGTLFKEIK